MWGQQEWTKSALWKWGTSLWKSLGLCQEHIQSEGSIPKCWMWCPEYIIQGSWRSTSNLLFWFKKQAVRGLNKFIRRISFNIFSDLLPKINPFSQILCYVAILHVLLTCFQLFTATWQMLPNGQFILFMLLYYPLLTNLKHFEFSQWTTESQCSFFIDWIQYKNVFWENLCMSSSL